MRFHETIISLFIVFSLSITLGSFSLHAEGKITKGTPILPGKTCQTEPLSNWTPQEKWVWKQVCEGKIADFNKADSYGGELDPKKPEEWPKSRILTPEFLEIILLHEPYRGALTRHGARILGAWFKEPLDLSHATLDHQLWLDNSRFDADVDLNTLITKNIISMNGSIFNGKLYMNRIEVKGSLIMGYGAEFKKVNLSGAKIGDEINMIGSKFNDKLEANSIEVGSHLHMEGGAEFQEVDLKYAKIGGGIDMTGAKFTGKLDMKRMEVMSDLIMRNGAEFQEVDLVGVKIGGKIEFSGSIFNSIDLTETIVQKEFILSSSDQISEWQEDSKLKLFNTKIGTLQDSRNSWPENLVLEGFVYDRLGKYYTNESKDTATRDITWLKEWLGKQKKYSPQPYEHLASVLRKSGHESMANSILYAGRERKRNEVATGLNWFGSTILKYAIGYGYGYRIFYSLLWIIFFIIAGMFCVRRNNEGKQRDIKWCFFYSLDLLLPIIKLDERHYEINLEGFARYYFYFHIVIGFIFASFVAAGISGLTQ